MKIDKEFSAEATYTELTVKNAFWGLVLHSQVGLHYGIQNAKRW